MDYILKLFSVTCSYRMLSTCCSKFASDYLCLTLNLSNMAELWGTLVRIWSVTSAIVGTKNFCTAQR